MPLSDSHNLHCGRIQGLLRNDSDPEATGQRSRMAP